MKNIVSLILITLSLFNLNSQVSDTLTYREKLNSGEYVPFIKLTKEDKIQFPIKYYVEINIDEISDLDIKENHFYSKFWHTYYSHLDTLEITKNNIPYYWYPEDYISLEYPESDRVFTMDYSMESKFYSETLNDSLNRFSRYVELELPHKWNLRSYPFDKQYLKYIFESGVDTSLQRIARFPDKPLNLPKNFDFLMDGYKISEITAKNSFKETTIYTDYVDGPRYKVVERLEFLVSIDRQGAFLYFKLFFGGFLSFLISYLVYFIEPKFFETRITLSLGGIFGSVGNKYFVENTMPAIQVLTKADLINNLVIIFIIINIFIVIGQHTKSINLKWFEKNKFAAITVFLLFILSNSLVVVL
tara:strand:- start:6505 stop:7581 length:1077 start_codon:yes stop_codon:yes gene_type:complete